MIDTSLEQIRSVQSEVWDEIYYEPTEMEEKAEWKRKLSGRYKNGNVKHK